MGSLDSDGSFVRGNNGEGKKETMHPPTLFISEGKLHLLRNNYRKAIDCFNEALEIKPNNARVMLLRSKCYSYLKEFDLAMKDAMIATELDKKSIEAEYQKGQIQFFMGDLEFAYLTFQRGLRKRLYENLKYGMQNCEQAVFNSIGPKSKFTITDENVKQVEMRLQLKRAEFGKKKETLENKAVLNFDNRSLYILLSYLGKDKIFVDQLLEAQNKTLLLPNVYKASESKIKIQVETAADFLNKCQDFWLTNKPLNYDQSRLLALEAPMQKSQDDDDGIQYRFSIKRYIKLAYEYIHSGQNEKCIEICKEMLPILRQTKTTTIKDTHRKEIIALKLMGQAYQNMKDYPSAIECYEGYRDLALIHVMNEELLRAYAYLGECYLEIKDYKTAVTYFKNALLKSPKKVTAGYILLHISYCECFMNIYKDAREYGPCILEIAQKKEDKELEIESIIFLAIVEYMDDTGMNAEKSTLYFEKALKLFKGLTGDSEKNTSLYHNLNLIHKHKTVM